MNYDKKPVCLMHSCDPKKSPAEFDAEIKSILSGTSEKHSIIDFFDFRGFVFSNPTVLKMKYTKAANFHGATFAEGANFSAATFTESVDFYSTTFAERADFIHATFIKNADFMFPTFTKEACFIEASFHEGAYFTGVTFTENAHFGSATFYKDAHFIRSTFTKSAQFTGATFTKGADFHGAVFTEDTDFQKASFLNEVNFEDTRFGALNSLVQPIADFRGASFLKPELVRFLKVNESVTFGLRIRFVNCRIEDVQFDAVHWYRNKHRMVLQDELDILEKKHLPPSYEEVAIAYRRLITNFEKARAYDLSEDCTVGEFEMKRRNPDRFLFAEWVKPFYERFPRLRASFGEQVSIVGIYRWASLYGTSYQRALVVLGVLLLGFGLFYSTIITIQPSSSPGETQISYCSDQNVFDVLCRGVLHSIETATLQRSTLYVPVSGFGFVVEVMQQILVAGQTALLLFALRRRFRR